MTEDGFVSALDDPAGVAAAAAALLNDGVPPTISTPNDTTVELPGGLILPDGTRVTDAEVQELTGEHEEALQRAAASGNAAKYIATLLESGVVKVGREPVSPHLLRSLLIGDRDALVLGIRRATFGDEVDLGEITCPECRVSESLTLTLDDIEIRPMAEPHKREYEIPLRRGGHALVRLGMGSDQEEVFRSKLPVAQQNTLFLSLCVLSLPDPTTGEQRGFTGTGPVQRLGLADRNKILTFLQDTQPGPQYDSITHTHTCGTEIPLRVTVGDLFQG